MDTITVSTRTEFVDEVMSHELPISKSGADELWDVWSYRYRHGATDDYLVFIPEWMSEQDFGKRRPYLFAAVEYDGEDKGSVLFRDARLIDPSIVENGVWSKVDMSDVLERVDLSETQYIDDPGKCWIARSQGTFFEMGDDDE